MSLKDDFAKLGDDSQRKRVGKSIPAGWEPKLDYDPEQGGTIVTVPSVPRSDDPAAAEIFEQFNLDPNQWRITSLRRSQWQKYDGEWLEAFRATFVPASAHNAVVPTDDLLAMVAKWKPQNSPRKPVKASQGGFAYVVVLADTQVGKIDGGGSDEIVANVLSKIDAAVIRYKELIKLGRPISSIYLLVGGDCIEGFNSQNGGNVWRTDLDLTSQIRVFRRLLAYAIKQLAPLTDRLIVASVPGNHDEAVRVNGKMGTTYTDSFALDAASAVQDALADRDDFKHVSFVFPKHDTMTITLDIEGTVTGLIHGHQARGKIIDWWKNQAHGQQDIGEATLLISGHFHHIHIEQTGRKTWIQVPALDGGSTWFQNATGQAAPAGLATLLVGNGGWQDLDFL